MTDNENSNSSQQQLILKKEGSFYINRALSYCLSIILLSPVCCKRGDIKVMSSIFFVNSAQKD